MGNGFESVELGTVIGAITALLGENEQHSHSRPISRPFFTDPDGELKTLASAQAITDDASASIWTLLGLRTMSDAALFCGIALVERVGRIVDAMRVGFAHEVDARTSPYPAEQENSFAHRYGFKNARALLQQVTGACGKTVSDRIKLGKACSPQVSLHGEELPAKHSHLGMAFYQGLVHSDAAQIISTGLGSLSPAVDPQAISLAEKVLTSHASGVEFAPGVFDTPDPLTDDLECNPSIGAPFIDHADIVRTRTHGWVAALDQDGAEPVDHQLRNRYLRFGRKYRGLVPIKGALLPEVAAKLSRVFDAITNPRVTPQDLPFSTETLLGDTDIFAELARSTELPQTAEQSGTADGVSGASGVSGVSGAEDDASGTAPDASRPYEFNSPGQVARSTHEAQCTEQPASSRFETQSAEQPASSSPETTCAEPASGAPAAHSAIPAADLIVPEDTKRSGDQKRHDAFAALINAAMKHQDIPSLGGEPVSLTIQVSQEDLIEGQGTAWFVDHFGDVAPTSIAAARHASCVGNILKVTQEDSGRITGLETHARVFNSHQRKAIIARDGGCIIPGCAESAIWCEIHHVHEHSEGGPTHTDNGVLLCWYHHRYLDHHGWQIRMSQGVPEVKPPPWLDPYQRWYPANSSLRPPRLNPNEPT